METTTTTPVSIAEALARSLPQAKPSAVSQASKALPAEARRAQAGYIAARPTDAATDEDIAKMLTMSLIVDKGQTFADNGGKLTEDKIRQLKNDIARLRPTKQQLLDMYDRFTRNPLYGDLSLSRFVADTIPLYTEAELERRIIERTKDAKQRLREMISHIQFDARRYQDESERILASEYYHMLQLRQEMQTAYYARSEQKLETERKKLKHRLYLVKLWLKFAPKPAVKDVFEIAKQRGIFKMPLALDVPKFDETKYAQYHPDQLAAIRTAWHTAFDEKIKLLEQRNATAIERWKDFPDAVVLDNAEHYAELLFDIVEQHMRRLPQTTQTKETTQTNTEAPCP